MTRTFFRLAAVSVFALATAAGVSAAHAQAVSDRYDGYCYVRPADMQRNSYTDNRGVTHSSARCYQGEYYAYSTSYYAAPAAPQGYQVEYFSHRPAQTYYDHVYEATSASSTYGSNDDGYQGDDRYSSDDRYGGNDQYADQRRYSDSDRYGDSSDDQDRSSNGSGYADNGGYAQDNRSSSYGNSSYSNSGANTSGYGTSGYGNSSYGNSSYDSSDNSPDSNNASYDPGYKSHSALAGWRDDAGQWHVGRPRAIGWEDENGKWHEGQVAAFGWRDSRGGWHEDNSSSASNSYDNGYSDDNSYGRSHAYNGN